MRTYISGKITGLPEETARRLFAEAASGLTGEVVNPMELVPPTASPTWTDYMVTDIAELLTCTHIFMLPNWRDSKGARVEHAIAVAMGLTVRYQSEPIATRILRDAVPPALWTPGRFTGETTRAVDAAVQELMETGCVTVPDGHTGRVLRARVSQEHGLLPHRYDHTTNTMWLVVPEAPERATAKRLLSAARELPATATGEEIAALAGESRTTINYHFGSVAELKRQAGVV